MMAWGEDSQESGLSSRLRLAAQCENGADGGSMPPSRDPERLISPENFIPKSTFSERVAEIALCGFILLAVVCGLARWF